MHRLSYTPRRSPRRSIHHLDDRGVELRRRRRYRVVIVALRRRRRRRRSRHEPVTAKVEETSVGPVARGHEEDYEQDAAVDAGAVEEVGADEEEEDEGGRGVGGDEEKGEPAASGQLRYLYSKQES